MYIESYAFTDFVGFAAYSTSNQSPDEGVDLQFRGLLTGAGGGYSTSSSRFTCPVSGYYYFYFSIYILSQDPSYQRCDIEMVMDETVMAQVSDIDSGVNTPQESK